MARRKARIGIVDPDAGTAQLLADHLTRTLDVDVATTCGEAATVRADRTHRFDLLLTELKLSDGDGLHLARQLQAYGRRAVIVMSGEPTLGRAVEAMRLGAKDLLTKPFDLAHLTTVVRKALDQHEQTERDQERLRQLRKTCRELERERRELRQRIELVCRDLVTAYGRLAERVVAIQPTADPAERTI